MFLRCSVFLLNKLEFSNTHASHSLPADEEKLTVDNCLCDACIRHVDRRANCPKRTPNTPNAAGNAEYNKMLKAAGLDDGPSRPSSSNAAAGNSATIADDDCTSQPMDIEMSGCDPTDDAAATGTATAIRDGSGNNNNNSKPTAASGKMCQVQGCQCVSAHTIRRKWYVKMRKPIGRLLNIVLPESGGGMLPLCTEHYNVIGHLLVCTLCKRKLVRNHIYYIQHVSGFEDVYSCAAYFLSDEYEYNYTISPVQDVTKLEECLASQGLPFTIGQSPIVCKLCRYFSNLLLKPPEEPQKVKFVKEYRRR